MSRGTPGPGAVSGFKYGIGLAIFCTYHGMVDLALSTGARLKPGSVTTIKDWHRRYYRDLLRSLLAKEGVNIRQ
jgi:hypothetical protein